MTTENLIRLVAAPAELRKLGVHLDYAKTWRAVTAGELDSVRDGSKVFVPRAALEAFAALRAAG